MSTDAWNPAVHESRQHQKLELIADILMYFFSEFNVKLCF